MFLFIMAMVGVIFGLRPLFSGGYGPSNLARAEIPAQYVKLYVQAGHRYGIDPWILAGIGWVETQHGRSTAPGVHSGVNAYGCCAGPMQFSIVGSPSTWDSYGVDGDHDGERSPYDPADAIPAAARYLRASGAPQDYRAALFAYNHAQWYVAQVLAKAELYRGDARAGTPQPPDAASVREVLSNPRITLTPVPAVRPALRGHRPARDLNARLDRAPPPDRRDGAEVRSLLPDRRRDRVQPLGRPCNGHRRRRRRGVPRYSDRQVR